MDEESNTSKSGKQTAETRCKQISTLLIWGLFKCVYYLYIFTFQNFQMNTFNDWGDCEKSIPIEEQVSF